MIDLLIAILIALKTGTACDLGQPIDDWYAYVAENPSLSRIDKFEFGIEGVDDAWLYEVDSGYVLFVFRERVDDVIASGRSDPHGRCARLLE
jgi:hypothetical protein